MSEEIRKLEEKAYSGAALTKEEKGALLIAWNYYNKEYSDNPNVTKEYPFMEFNGTKLVTYNIVPYGYTDEEFGKIVAQNRKTQKEKERSASVTTEKTNTIAIIFKLIGYVVFLAAFILGFVLGKEPGHYRSEQSFPLMLLYWVGGFVSGMFMIGFGEVIQLLQDIKDKR